MPRRSCRGGRRYGRRRASRKVERAMHERKEGTLRSGRSGRRVKSRDQAIAIGLNEARREGARVPSRGGRSRSQRSSSHSQSSRSRSSSRPRRSAGRGRSRSRE